jgi:CAAX protease family protein
MGPTGEGGQPGGVAPRWGIGDALAGFFVGLLLSTLGVVVALGGARTSPGGTKTLAVVVANLLGLWLGLVGAPVLACRLKGSGSLRADFGFEIRPWPDVPLGVACGLASQLLLLPLLYLPFHGLVTHLDQRLGQPARQLTGGSTGAGLVLVALLLTVGAPVVEELFFRGLVQRSIEKSLAGLARSRAGGDSGGDGPGAPGGPVTRAAGRDRSRGPGGDVTGEGTMEQRRGRALASVVLSSLAFGLAHAQSLQLLGLVAFGLVLGALARLSGRLGPGIVAHAVFNAVAVVGALAAL